MRTPKDAKIFLRLLQAHGKFKNVPVNWKPSKKGPRYHVSGPAHGTISVSVNYSGLSISELEQVVQSALKHANDMYREVTFASVIATEATGRHEGIPWSETVRGRKELVEEVKAELSSAEVKAALLGRIESVFVR